MRAGGSIVLFGLVSWACSTKEASSAASDEATAVQTVETGDVSSLPSELTARLALELAPTVEVDVRREVECYGRIVIDSASRSTLRAAVAGTLRAEHWPRVGDSVEPTAHFAVLEARLSTGERIDLAARRAEVERDRDRARIELASAEKSLERARTLNAEDKSVSDRALEDAELHVATLRGDLASADARTAALTAGGAEFELAVALERGGEVLEVFVHPGEVVEAGAPLLDIADLSRPLAEVRIPVGSGATSNAATLVSLRTPERSFAAVIESRAVESTFAADEAVRLRVESGAPLRPGEPVVARLALDGAPLHGVEVPTDSIVRLAGKTWVYLEGAHGFERVEVALESPTARGWLSTNPRLRGARLVVGGAQMLLSTELLERAGGTEEE